MIAVTAHAQAVASHARRATAPSIGFDSWPSQIRAHPARIATNEDHGIFWFAVDDIGAAQPSDRIAANCAWLGEFEMPAIFVSYRRDDSGGESGRLFADLEDAFGQGSVFMDVAAIEPGRDFREAIERSIATCGVLLAVIGKDWIEARDDAGQRRLDNASDFVRVETAAALGRGIPVIPVLVRGAKMPRAEQLPEDMKELAYRNGVELTHARWNSDLQLLINALRAHVGTLSGDRGGQLAASRGRAPMSRRLLLGALAAAILVTASVVGYLAPTFQRPAASTAERPPANTTARFPSSAVTRRQEEDLKQRMLSLTLNRKPPEKPFTLFTLAQRYEGYSVDHIGSDFAGDYFYGTYRISARASMNEFLGFLRQYYPAFAQRLDAAGGADGALNGGEKFARAWKDLAQASDFSNAQQDFLERSNYQRLARRLAQPRDAAQPSRGGLGVDLRRRSIALQAVMFSIAIQYGPGTSLPIDALKHFNNLNAVSDAEMIEALYRAREQITLYFPDISSDDYVTLLKQRNRWEKEDALYMLRDS